MFCDSDNILQNENHRQSLKRQRNMWQDEVAQEICSYDIKL